MKKTISTSNDDLIRRIFEDEDRLSRDVVEEFIRRADEMIPVLSSIVKDRSFWTANLPEWWAPIHATYILGAISGAEVLTPLLAALRWADAYDNEWVVEDLPSMFAKVGSPAIQKLKGIAMDESAGWTARTIAFDSLAAISIAHPEHERRLLHFIEGILCNEDEEKTVRRSAAIILIDFRKKHLRTELMKVVDEERRVSELDDEYRCVLTVADLDRELSLTERAEDYYVHNWLQFYNPEEISKRQVHWSEEDSRDRMRLAFAMSPQDAEEAVESLRLCPCGSGRRYTHCCLGKLH